MTSGSTDPEEGEAFFAEHRDFLLKRSLNRGHFYPFTSINLMASERPDYARLVFHGLAAFPNRLWETGADAHAVRNEGEQYQSVAEITVQSLGNLAMYVDYGWETGIFNEFRHLQERGFSREQIIEICLFGHLQGGIRGLQHIYNAVAQLLVDFTQREAPDWLPRGWGPDPGAFKAGLDLSTRDLTGGDRQAIERWHESTIGYVPNSVRFALDYHPEFYKWHRARWEVICKTLPKQAAPYMMFRQQMIRGSPDGLREAALLGRAWGMAKEWVVQGIMTSAFYTGFEGLYAAQAGLDDILHEPGW
jgi:hypothetical protein